MSRAWMLSLLTGAVTICIKAVGVLSPSEGRSSSFERIVQQLTPLLLPGVLSALIVVQGFSDQHRLTVDARAIGLVAAVLAVRFRATPAITLMLAAMATGVARLIYTYAMGTLS